MVAEIVLVEIGEVNGDDIGDGMIAERSLAGKAGDGTGGQPVVFNIRTCYGIGQADCIRRIADAKMQGEIADGSGEARRIQSRDGKANAGSRIFSLHPGEDQPVTIEAVGPGLDRPDARDTGDPQQYCKGISMHIPGIFANPRPVRGVPWKHPGNT